MLSYIALLSDQCAGIWLPPEVRCAF